MASVHREVEAKYDASPEVALPSLDRLPGVASVPPPVEADLEAVYFDTAELALASAGITVRRRTGGDDAGWHLKLPAGDGARDELGVPLGRAVRTVPMPLRKIVRAHSRDRPLGPVATIRTRRCVHRLLDADGRLLAEICDDTASATTPASVGNGDPVRWREWEVELVDGSPKLLVDAGKLLREAGASPAATSSKLARVLGHRIPDNGALGLVRNKPGVSAGDLVVRRLREQVAELKLRDPQARQDAPDGVHKMRVALRRLRSALATFRPLFDREVTDPLRDELKWVATALGAARDAEVMTANLGAAISAEPVGMMSGPSSRWLLAQLHRAHRDARRTAVEVLDSDRYLAVLESVDRLVTEPPWKEKAHPPGRTALSKRVRRDWKRLRRRVAETERVPDGPQRDEALHEVRKAAKRTRYAAETLVPIHGRDARRFAQAVKHVQRALGDHHDGVVAQPLLRDLGEKAHAHGHDAFGYGRLHRHEQYRAEAAKAHIAGSWNKASRKKLRRWLG